MHSWSVHIREYQWILSCKQQNLYSQIRSVAQSCPTLCNPMNRSTPGLPVHHQLPEFTETHVHQVSDAIQPSHPLSSPSPLALNPSQHQSLFQWVNPSHEMAKVLEFQLSIIPSKEIPGLISFKAFDCVDHNKLWKALKQMGIPNHLTCLLRNLYACQEATVRTLLGAIDWFKIEKGVRQGCLLSLCLFNVYTEHIMRNAGLDELQAGIKIGRRNINNLRYVDDTTLWQKSKRN